MDPGWAQSDPRSTTTRVLDRVFSRKRRELARLERMPRRTRTSTTLLGFPMSLVDAASFLSQYNDIYRHGTYAVRFDTAAPRIIDCGANVGMSVLYWKWIAPGSVITAFEPDPEIADVLASNLSAAGAVDRVDIIRAAVCARRGSVEFAPDGADAGHIGPGELVVPAVQLRDYLTGKIDLLKLDIDAILDSADLLHHVERIVLEYHSLADPQRRLGAMLGALEAAGFQLIVSTEHAPPRPLLPSSKDGDLENRLNVYGRRT
jgi:FkbM family methyltransferase